jgi:hypothetical protein
MAEIRFSMKNDRSATSSAPTGRTSLPPDPTCAIDTKRSRLGILAASPPTKARS